MRLWRTKPYRHDATDDYGLGLRYRLWLRTGLHSAAEGNPIGVAGHNAGLHSAAERRAARWHRVERCASARGWAQRCATTEHRLTEGAGTTDRKRGGRVVGG